MELSATPTSIIRSGKTLICRLQFSTQGAINFSYRYQYNSGIYVSGTPVPPGLIYLIGTKNNTVAYANPFNGTNSLEVTNTDRSIGIVSSFSSRYAFDFGVRQVKPVTFAFYHRDSIIKTIELWGSNSLGIFVAGNIDNNALWTQLGTMSNPVGASWNFITVLNSNYWQYLKFRPSDGTTTLSCQEIELYNSSAISPTVNFS
jgi:hypothetical protein